MSVCLFSSLSDVKQLFFNAGGQQHINGGEIGDKYIGTYGCPVKKGDRGIGSKVMMMMFPIMSAVRGGGDLSGLD